MSDELFPKIRSAEILGELSAWTRPMSWPSAIKKKPATEAEQNPLRLL